MTRQPKTENSAAALLIGGRLALPIGAGHLLLTRDDTGKIRFMLGEHGRVHSGLYGTVCVFFEAADYNEVRYQVSHVTPDDHETSEVVLCEGTFACDVFFSPECTEWFPDGDPDPSRRRPRH